MLSHQEMVGLQAEKHDLINESNFESVEQYVLHLMHSAAYTNVAEVVAGRAVLDLGCNTGYGTKILSGGAKTIVGIDVSERAVSEAQRKYADNGIQFCRVDGGAIPFDDHEFDVITCFQVIEHIVDYQIFLSELKRILAPRGIVIFTTPNQLIRLDPGMKPWNEFHVREFTHEDLASTLALHFKNVAVLGLHATPDVYAIEANRCDKARRAARSNSSDGGVSRHNLRRRLIQILPGPVLKYLKRFEFSDIKNMKAPRSRARMLKDAQRNYGIEDFEYRRTSLDSSLDFMAICSDAEIETYARAIAKTGH